MNIFDKPMDIKRRVVILVLICSIGAIIVSGFLSLVGMYRMRSSAVSNGLVIGDEAADSSLKALEDQAQNHLKSASADKAKQIESMLGNLQAETRIIANEMTVIMQHPELYSQVQISEPNRFSTGIVPYVMYFPGVNRSAVQNELLLAGNIRDFLQRVYDVNIPIASVYVASKNGFGIYVDDESASAVDPVTGEIMPYDASERPWYQLAEAEQKLIFTDVFNDSEGKGLAISCAAPYYDRYGDFAGVVGIGALLREVDKLIDQIEIGNNGWCFVMGQNGNVLFSSHNEGVFAESPDNEKRLADISDSDLSALAKKMVSQENGIGTFKLDGEDYYLAYAPIKRLNMSFGAVLPISEVIAPALETKNFIEQITNERVDFVRENTTRILILLSLATLVIAGIVSKVAGSLSERLVKPLHKLADGVREISAGNLDKKLDIHTGDEIEHLAVCFNAMTDELKIQMKNLATVSAERERIATELDVAKNIQLSALPREFPNRDDFQIFASMNAAKSVGGDFYDFYMLDERHVVITIADVSGKGVPAALFMMISKTILKNYATMMNSPDDFASVMKLANDQLCHGNDEMMFVTTFIGMIDLDKKKFIYVNGGHNPPVIYRPTQDRFDFLNVDQNCVLGLMDGMDFSQQEIDLESGDVIFLYTDGVTEAMNEKHEQFTDPRLLECLNSTTRRCTLEDLLGSVKKSLADHVGNAEQSDDITMLAFRLN